MRRMSFSAALTLLSVATLAPLSHANMTSLGFHSVNAPLGVRSWFNEKVAGDFGFGYTDTKSETGPGTVEDTGSRIEIGVPIRVMTLEKAHFIVRPGYEWFNDVHKVTGAADVTTTGYVLSGELELEYFMTDRVSLSASHGIAYTSSEDDDTPKTKDTTFQTLGNNFTNIGFHVYLWK